MDSQIVTCKIEGAAAIIKMDDGNSNVISPRMLHGLNKALDQAENNKAVVILTGREDVFSAGFDLKILKRGGVDVLKMLIGGFKLVKRMLSFPTPIIIASNGHAMAMGAFLLLAGDYRIGSTGPFKIETNEVAIGLTMPSAGIEICRQRLSQNHFVRAVLLSEKYSPETAIGAGFLDQIVSPDSLMKEAGDAAAGFAKLDMTAHYETKLRLRHQVLKGLKKAISSDRRDFIIQGSLSIINKI